MLGRDRLCHVRRRKELRIAKEKMKKKDREKRSVVLVHCDYGVEWRMQLVEEKAGSYFGTLIIVNFIFLLAVVKGPYHYHIIP